MNQNIAHAASVSSQAVSATSSDNNVEEGQQIKDPMATFRRRQIGKNWSRMHKKREKILRNLANGIGLDENVDFSFTVGVVGAHSKAKLNLIRKETEGTLSFINSIN
jgi:hypothetical protein